MAHSTQKIAEYLPRSPEHGNNLARRKFIARFKVLLA